jgi:hypothetical protein
MKLTLAGWALALILCIFLYAKCNESPPETSAELASLISERDSVLLREEVLLKKYDSLNLQAHTLTAKITEEKRGKDSVSRELKKSEQKLRAFANSYRLGLLQNDTPRALLNCDSAIAEQQNLLGYAHSLEEAYETATKYYEQRDSVRLAMLAAQKQVYDSLKASFNRVSANYMESLIKRTVKQKRFSVGPAVGGGFGNGLKPTGFIGVTVQYQLFKF